MRSREPYISITTLPREAYCGTASLGVPVVIHLQTRYNSDAEKSAVGILSKRQSSFFSQIMGLIRWTKQKELWQNGVLNHGYHDHFPTAVIIIPQSQRLLRALKGICFMHHWFCPIGLLHLNRCRYKYLYLKKNRKELFHIQTRL